MARTRRAPRANRPHILPRNLRAAAAAKAAAEAAAKAAEEAAFYAVLPKATVVSQKPITDADLFAFKGIKHSPMDCAINALQIMGVITEQVANLLRITSLGKKNGLNQTEIQKIFILHYPNNFSFAKANTFAEFATTIKTTLNRGHVCFAGYMGHHGVGHVFIIGRKANGELVLIDPQQKLFCELKDDPCTALIGSGKDYYLLFHSAEGLTKTQQKILVEGFPWE